MKKASLLFSRIMLGLLALFLLGALLLAAINGLESHSYLFALVLGGVAALGLQALFRRSNRSLQAAKPSVSYGRTGLILAVLCFGLNLAWVLIIRIEPFSDYDTYWQTACAIAFGRPVPNSEYIAMYPHILGYASVLALPLKVFGEHVMVAAVLNVALTTISAVLVYRLSLRFLGYKRAVVAALLWIFFPAKLMLNSLVFSEPLYTMLVLLFFFLVSEADDHEAALSSRLFLSAALGLGGGVLLAAINLVRPIAAILIIAYYIWLFLLRGEKSRKAWRPWLILSVCLLAAYSLSGRLWDAHTERVLGEEPSSFPIYNVYVGINEETKGQWSAEDMDLLFSYRHKEGASASSAQEDMLPHLKERLGSGIDFLSLFSAKLKAFLGDDELGGYTYRFTRPETFVKLCMAICNTYFYFVLLLALGGIWRMSRRQEGASLLLPLFALGLTLAHMLVEVCNRYHYSLIPVFVVLAAFSLPGERDKNQNELEED